MSLRRELALLLLAAGLVGCAPARSEDGDDADPLALVDRLVDSRPFSRRRIEGATGVALVPNRAASNPFYSLWVSERGAGFLARVELREPGPGATRRGGLLVLDLDPERAGVVHTRIPERYGEDYAYEPPGAHGPPGAPAYYLYRREWGELRFGFRLSDGALVTVVLDAER
jgi:hypothetical protein